MQIPLTSQDLMILRDLVMRRPCNDKAYAVAVSMMNHDEHDALIMRNHSHSFPPLHRDTQGYRNTYAVIHAQDIERS